MNATLENVEAVARESRGDKHTVNRCRAVNASVSTTLEDELDIHTRVVRGAIRDPEGHIAHHVYVRIPAGELADYEGEVIVDAALDQFNDQTFQEDITHATFGPSGSVPKVVVATAGDREWEYFTTGM